MLLLREEAAMAFVGVALAALAWAYRRDRSRQRRRRGAIFSDCLELFEAYRVDQDGVAFAMVSGRYRGYEVRLEPIEDHVAFRKIPSLWLRVTVCAAVPYRGIFDLLARPRGGEFYSPFDRLPCELPNPPGWPLDARIHVDDLRLVPNVAVIAPSVRLFADERMKELLVTPRGVRLVYQLSQADRTHYVVLRQLEFEEVRLDAALAERLLNAAVALHESVVASAALTLATA